MGYTYENVYFSGTKGHKEQKLVKMIAVTIFYNYAKIQKGTSDIGEKSLANEGGIQIKLLISQ